MFGSMLSWVEEESPGKIIQSFHRNDTRFNSCIERVTVSLIKCALDMYLLDTDGSLVRSGPIQFEGPYCGLCYSINHCVCSLRYTSIRASSSTMPTTYQQGYRASAGKDLCMRKEPEPGQVL